MDAKPMECGSMGLMMGNGNEVKILCAPLERLKKEHEVLRGQLEHFRNLAISIGVQDDSENLNHLTVLREQITAFDQALTIHSDKEEDTLFPMMARYIGRDVGPIAVMEYEHEQARKHLQKFLERTQSLPPQFDREEARENADIAVEAAKVLSIHFMKEDNILFPMADSMLSEDEKARLDRRI